MPLRRAILALVVTLPLASSGCLNAAEPASLPDCGRLAANLGTATGLVTTASGLQYRDVVVGAGTIVTPGLRVITQYAACTTDGQTFAAAVGESRLVFTAGEAQVFPGLDEGVIGMKLGGRRQLVVPPRLGFGANGSVGGFVVPNDTIVITVDAIGVR